MPSQIKPSVNFHNEAGGKTVNLQLKEAITRNLNVIIPTDDMNATQEVGPDGLPVYTITLVTNESFKVWWGQVKDWLDNNLETQIVNWIDKNWAATFQPKVDRSIDALKLILFNDPNNSYPGNGYPQQSGVAEGEVIKLKKQDASITSTVSSNYNTLLNKINTNTSNISTNSTNITNEIANRTNADNALQTKFYKYLPIGTIIYTTEEIRTGGDNEDFLRHFELKSKEVYGISISGNEILYKEEDKEYRFFKLKNFSGSSITSDFRGWIDQNYVTSVDYNTSKVNNINSQKLSEVIWRNNGTSISKYRSLTLNVYYHENAKNLIDRAGINGSKSYFFNVDLEGWSKIYENLSEIIIKKKDLLYDTQLQGNYENWKDIICLNVNGLSLSQIEDYICRMFSTFLSSCRKNTNIYDIDENFETTGIVSNISGSAYSGNYSYGTLNKTLHVFENSLDVTLKFTFSNTNLDVGNPLKSQIEVLINDVKKFILSNTQNIFITNFNTVNWTWVDKNFKIKDLRRSFYSVVDSCYFNNLASNASSLDVLVSNLKTHEAEIYNELLRNVNLQFLYDVNHFKKEKIFYLEPGDKIIIQEYQGEGESNSSTFNDNIGGFSIGNPPLKPTNYGKFEYVKRQNN